MASITITNTTITGPATPQAAAVTTEGSAVASSGTGLRLTFALAPSFTSGAYSTGAPTAYVAIETSEASTGPFREIGAVTLDYANNGLTKRVSMSGADAYVRAKTTLSGCPSATLSITGDVL